MGKRIIGHEKAVEALAGLCENYRASALRAVREGYESVYIPAGIDNSSDMLDLLRNPDGLLKQLEGTVFTSSNKGLEPVYVSLEEGQTGRNHDGTPHAGFIEVDVIAKKVIGYMDREGKSLVPKVAPLMPETLINELKGNPGSYCF